MEKLEKIIYKAVVKPIFREKLYIPICQEVEAAISEVEDVLPCLELLNELYPQSMDLAYLTAAFLCRNELYREAWQLLSVGCPIFSKANRKAEKIYAEDLEKKPNKWKNHPTVENVECSCAKVGVLPRNQKCNEVVPKTPDSSEWQSVSGKRLNQTTLSSENCDTEEHSLLLNEENSKALMSECKDRCDNVSESKNFTSTDSSTKFTPFDEIAKDKVNCSLCSSPMLYRYEKKVRDPCYRTLEASVVNGLVDRWHIPMLNDKIRNLAFKNALRNSITGLIEDNHSKKLSSRGSKSSPIYALNLTPNQESDRNLRNISELHKFQETSSTRSSAAVSDEAAEAHPDLAGSHSGVCEASGGVQRHCSKMKVVRVLDVGSGSGLLSLYAACAPEVEVTGCDTSAVMCEVAEEVVRVNSSTAALEAGAEPDPHILSRSATPRTPTGVAESEVNLKRSAGAAEKCKAEQKKRPRRQGKPRKLMKPHQSIRILNIHSSALELTERADLVVSETVDAALLGEQCIPTVLDAWRRLLKPPPPCLGSPAPRSRVVPGRAEAYVAVVESAYICRYSKPLGRQNDLSSYGPISITSVSGEEPYNTERLEHLPEGYELLSQWYKVFHIDFNSSDDLVKFTAGNADKICALRCSTSGKVDAVVLCFRLYVDENNVIDTRPGNDRCWETAVYPSVSRRSVRTDEILVFRLTASDVIRVIPVDDPRIVSIMTRKINEKVKEEDENSTRVIRASYTEILDDEVKYVLKNELYFGLGHVTQAKSTAEEEEYLKRSNVSELSHLESSVRLENFIQEVAEEKHFVLPPSTLRAYNSLTFTSAFRRAAQIIASKLRSCNGEILVYDETPFPIAGLELHRSLPNVTVVVLQASVQSFLTSNNVKSITIEELLDARSSSERHPTNGGSTASMSRLAGPLLTPDNNRECGLSTGHPHAGPREPHQSPQHVLFSAMFVWPLNHLGVLDEDFNAKVTFCQKNVSGSGFVYPSSIDVYGTCVASDSLLSYTRVNDDNTCGVRVAATLHMLKTTHQLDVTLQSLPHVQLTDVVHLFTISMMSGAACAPSASNSRSPSDRRSCYSNPIVHSSSSDNDEITQPGDRSDEQTSSKALQEHDDDCAGNGFKNLSSGPRLMRSKQARSGDEARSAVALHSRGLLAFNDRTLFERTVRLPIKKKGQVAGVAHWFRLRGIFDSSNDSNLEENELGEVKQLVTGDCGTLPYIQQTSNCDNIDMKSHVAEMPCEIHTVPKIGKTPCNSPPAEVLCTQSSNLKSRAEHSISICAESLSKIKSNTVASCSFSPSFPVISPRKENCQALSDSSRTSFPDLQEKTTGVFRPGANVITVGEESPCNQASFMVDYPFEAEPHQQVQLDCVYKSGCFWIDVYPET